MEGSAEPEFLAIERYHPALPGNDSDDILHGERHPVDFQRD
jgi:hypothetical protein